jgi:MFS family permease
VSDLLGPESDDLAGDTARPGRLSLLSRVAVDISPLRASQPFRRLWFGTGISAIGSQITTVAIPFQVFDLTGSTLLVGLLGAVALPPLLTVSLYAGSVADAVDRRRLLLLSDLGLLVVTAVLLGNALLPNPQVWLLFVAEAVGTAAYAFQRPARNAITPRLVPDDQLTAAIAVEDVVSNLAHVAGPAAGGLLIAALGLEVAYGLDLLSFGASLVAIWLLPPLAPTGAVDRPGIRSVLEGLRYVRTQPALLGTFLVDTNAMIFGMPTALFPAFAKELGGGPQTLGLLYAAPYAGAFGGSLLSGWVTRVRRQGLGVFVAAGLWGVAIALAGVAGSIPLVLLLLAAAGAADFFSAVLRSTILLAATPDAMRGRLSGIELAQVASAPMLGNVEAGVVASLTSVRFSIASGGIACVAGTVLFALTVPALRHYQARGTPA